MLDDITLDAVYKTRRRKGAHFPGHYYPHSIHSLLNYLRDYGPIPCVRPFLNMSASRPNDFKDKEYQLVA